MDKKQTDFCIVKLSIKLDEKLDENAGIDINRNQ